MMCGPDGKLTRDAMLLLHYFRVFCRAHPGAPLAPVSPDGRIDPMLLARNAGRREVYDELFRILAASPIAAYQVENPLL